MFSDFAQRMTHILTQNGFRPVLGEVPYVFLRQDNGVLYAAALMDAESMDSAALEAGTDSIVKGLTAFGEKAGLRNTIFFSVAAHSTPSEQLLSRLNAQDAFYSQPLFTALYVANLQTTQLHRDLSAPTDMLGMDAWLNEALGGGAEAVAPTAKAGPAESLAWSAKGKAMAKRKAAAEKKAIAARKNTKKQQALANRGVFYRSSERGQSKRVWLTYTIFAANVIVLLLMELAGGSESINVLLRFGAVEYKAVVVNHEWTRLLTAMFMHIGVMHLVYNSISLYIFGTRVERHFGRVRFLAVYLLTGIAGNLAQVFLMDGVSAGASGAIYGLMGATLAVTQRTKEPLEDMSLYMVVIFILIGLAQGFLTPGVGYAAHIGGLLAGYLLGLLMCSGSQASN